MNFLALYEKLEALAKHLPAPLQSPILKEIRPLRLLFLHRRAPRILLLGDRATSRSTIVNQLFGHTTAETTEDHLQDGTWQLFEGSTGRLRVLDGRRPLSLTALRRALTIEAPDAILYLHTAPLRAEDSAADLQHASEVIQLAEERGPGRKLTVLGVAAGLAGGEGPETSRRQLDRAIHDASYGAVRERLVGLFTLQTGPAEIERLKGTLVPELPEEARLEMVRLSGLKSAQLEMAQSVVKSMSAICGAVGTQPIPLADFPVLTSLQALMVAGIMHISGKDLSVRQAGEWLAAVGANIGLGLALREGTRAVLKLVPVWGDIVSGGIAAGGTFAIGRAATAYFIEGANLAAARAIFRKKKKKKQHAQSD